MTRVHSKTKLVCTIGPASRSDAMLEKLLLAGMNVARLNFAHEKLEKHHSDIQAIRRASAKTKRPCQILADLPGPKIRVGQIKHEPVELLHGREIWLTSEKVVGTSKRVSVEYPHLAKSVKKGGLVFLNDGFMQLQVLQIKGTDVRCRVLIGGPLLSHKGLNLPSAKLLVDAVTDQDLKFVEFGLSEGVDFFGVSFVQKAADILKVRAFAHKRGKIIRTIAKIERSEAIRNIDSILKVTDGIMVARGDLGVEVPIETVPLIQKRLIAKANWAGIPVITATQMLESMTHNIRPTRAEVTDVANAILDGTDGVMLSEETAIGEYPVQTVDMMEKIAVAVEKAFLKEKSAVHWF
ncbi:MAG TPA: pyruvate kinase [bacterium]|nr:pyruvate kinase [bacterium]